MTSEDKKNLQDYILDSMTLIAKNQIADASYTKIEEGVIVAIVDEALGKYKVKYLDNIIAANSAYMNMTYVVNEKVYLLSTNDNLDEAKLILGAVTPSAANFTGGTSGSSFLEISDNLFNGMSEVVELSSYYHRMPGEASPHDEKKIDIIGSDFNRLLTEYINDYTKEEEGEIVPATFSFSANIKTVIPDDQFTSSGDYGICLELPTKIMNQSGDEQTESVHKYFLNTTTLTGNPYQYPEFTTKNIIVSLDNYEFYDSSRYANIYAYVDNNFKQDDDKKEEYDIFIRDVSLKCVEVYEVDTSTYNLSLVATDGPNFLKGSTQSEKLIKPVLRIGGKSTSIDPYNCYWFKEDVSVKNSSNEFFHSVGGIGWKCLNSKTTASDGTEQLVTTEKTLTVFQTDILTSCRYKCVLDCEGVGVSAIITIKNLDSELSIEMVSDQEIIYPNSGVVNFTCKVDYPELLSGGSKDKTLKYEWSRHDKNDNLIMEVDTSDIKISTPDIENNVFVCHYSLPVSYINYSNTIYCSVYTVSSTNEVTLIGTVNKNVNITDVSQAEFTLLLENGDLIYKYDTDGNSPMLANYNGAMGSTPTSILPIDFKIFKKDGTEFTKDEYGVCDIEWTIPKNSMYSIVKKETLVINEDEDNYYVKNKTMPYEILGRYDAHKAAADVVLKVDFQGTILQAKPRIVFTKDGEGGTNGSMYTALITHDGYAYNEYDPEHNVHRKLKFVWVCNTEEGAGNWYYHDQKNKALVPLTEGHKYGFDVVIYKGTTLQSIEKKVTWSIFDKQVTNPCFAINEEGVLSKIYNWESPDSIFCTTVEAKIQVGNLGETDSEEYIYAYYPIEITRLSTNGTSIVKTDKDNIIPHIADGYSTVVYAEDGTNPSWNTQPFKCVSPSIQDADLKGYYSYVWSSSDNLIAENRTTQSCTFDPVTKFDSGVSKNYVKVKINAVKALEQKEIEEYDKDAEEKINNYKSYLNKINEIITSTEKWLSRGNIEALDKTLSSASDYLNARSVGIRIVNNMKSKVLDIRKTFASKDDLTYFKKVGYFAQYEDIYGNDFLEYIQQYVSKLCSFNLTKKYDAKDVKSLKIEELNISGLQPDQFFLDYLTPRGKVVYDNAVNDLNNYAKLYNEVVSDFAKNNFEDYIYKNSYTNFTKYIEKLLTYKNDVDLVKIGTYIFGDKDNTTIINILDQLAVSYKIICSLKSTYDEGDNCITKDITNITNDIGYNYFKEKILTLEDIFKIYGNYVEEEDSKYYIVKESLYEIFEKGKESYSINCEKLQAQVDARDAIYKSGEASIIHIKPIVMTFNRYGNSYINGWDGNKLYIDEENGQYLFAPQVGAGYKEEGRFTGMLMGLRGSNGASDDTDVGLFGYHQGEQSIFLDARKGSATFGVSGEGQIILDPTVIDPVTKKRKASITSGNYKEPEYDDNGNLIHEGSGMEIDLAIPAIKYGTGNFSVDAGGNMVAQTGWIGGWEIGVSDTGRYKDGTSVLHSPKTDSSLNFDNSEAAEVIYFDSNAIKDENGNFVRATKNQNAAIYSGNHNDIKKTSPGFFIDSEGMSINSYFRIDSESVKIGDLGNGTTNHYWTIKGKPADGNNGESYSYIAYGTEKFSGTNAQYYDEDRGIYTDPTTTVYLGTNGICLGDKFWVNPEGYLYSEKGRIANWLILKNRLLGNNGKMDFNSKDGYLSYTSTATSHEYNSAETREDIFNIGKGFFLGTDGLYFGRWNTFMDSTDGYIHATYGDIGGFHFTGNEMESGKVPLHGYVNQLTGKEYRSEDNILKKARGLDNLIDDDGNTIHDDDPTKPIFTSYYPYNNEEKFSNYMKLSAKQSALMFNTFDFIDLYNHFVKKQPPIETDTESTDFTNEEVVTATTEIIHLIGNTTIDPEWVDKGIYVGRKGINVGTNFSVNSSGNLYARNGMIGGWIIKEKSLSSPIVEARDGGRTYKYKTVFKPEGTLQGGRLAGNGGTNRWDSEKMWKLNKNGEAWFTNIKVTGGTLNINNAFVVNEDGSFRAGDKFRVDTDGVVYCTDAVIGGFRFGEGWARTNNSDHKGIYTDSNGVSSLGGWTLTDDALYDTESGGNNTFFGVNGGFKLQGANALMLIKNGNTEVNINNSTIKMHCDGSFILDSAHGALSLTPSGYGEGTVGLRGNDIVMISSPGGYCSCSTDAVSLASYSSNTTTVKGGNVFIEASTIKLDGTTIKIGDTELGEYIKSIVRNMGFVASHTHNYTYSNWDSTNNTNVAVPGTTLEPN